MSGANKMNILFLTLVKIDDISDRGIYTDLLRYFIKEGHKVKIATPLERRYKTDTHLINRLDYSLLRIKTLNIQKTNYLEKGFGTLLIEYQFKNAILKYYKDIKFDLILYSTPPITFTNTIQAIKRKFNAKSYLLLKDIFPQNAVDLKLFSKSSLIYKYFRKKEKKLYMLSDYIGCMSKMNVEYILKHNPEIDKAIVEVCPNSVELNNVVSICESNIIREKYNIPLKSTIFIYGGNLGKPQGIEFLIRVIESNKDFEDRFFIISGSGTEFQKIRDWFLVHNPKNAKLIKTLPKQEYDELVQICNVGLIFLDPRFTIPNYPSRLLTYLEYRIPILLATDINTDIGSIAENNGYGFWCENGNLKQFNQYLNLLCSSDQLRTEMGERGYEFLRENYTVEKSYNIIIEHFK